jgi:hypothetical protein
MTIKPQAGNRQNPAMLAMEKPRVSSEGRSGGNFPNPNDDNTGPPKSKPLIPS